MNSNYRAKVVMLVALVMLPSLACGQEALHSDLSNFAASDGAFSFSYPRDFQVCTSGKIAPCLQTYIPVCDSDALICAVYPSEPFKGTSFGTSIAAEAFQVREIASGAGQMTPDICVTPYPRKDADWPEFLVSAERPTELIGTIRFLHGVKSEAALSHSRFVDVYRAFHKGRCFELSVSSTGTDPGAYDPPLKTLTTLQQKRLDDTMSRILHSFRFSK